MISKKRDFLPPANTHLTNYQQVAINNTLDKAPTVKKKEW